MTNHAAMFLRLVVVAVLLLSLSEAWVLSYHRCRPLTRKRSVATVMAAVNNNIVLHPSADPAAFDSYKIGNARVHRYTRQDTSETEYVMWYHGRPKDMPSKNLPPLSTGRIGRAISRNGLMWEKDTTGSASEDAPDVSLGLNKDAWWGFDTSHVGLGNVLLPMNTPAVLTDGGVYLMYFMGGSFEETLLKDYMDHQTPDDDEMMQDDVKVQGMKLRIGVAVSQDGISWGRVEGDDPSGAIVVPFDKSDPNQQAEGLPSSVEEELYCAWPEVVVNPSAPEGKQFVMYYSTMTKHEKQKCIGYATSKDGFRWNKQGICVKPDPTGVDSAGCARCCVLRDAIYDDEKESWEELNAWTMYYEGVSPVDRKHRIMFATSKDGRSWTKIGVALDVGEAEDAWDFGGVGSPHVLRMDDGSMRMYYTGQGSDGSTAIGVAKLVEGEKPTRWLREQATITFSDNAAD